MPIFDTFQRAGFGGLQFPVDEIEVTGGIRDHVHEYPHADGGAPEKLGRRLYTIRMSANMQSTFPKWPGLYPGTLRALRAKFEAQTTDALVIPTLGTMQAYCRNWKQLATSKILSGEKLDLEFAEDMSAAFILSKLVDTESASFSSMAGDVDAALAEYTQDRDEGPIDNSAAMSEQQKENEDSLFDRLLSAVRTVLALGDLAQLAVSLVEAKLLTVIDLIQQIDTLFGGRAATASIAQLLQALHALWDVAQAQVKTGGSKVQLLYYNVPTLLSVGDVSKAIYGDASHAMDLLGLNPIADAFQIPAGTRIRYYPDAA